MGVLSVPSCRVFPLYFISNVGQTAAPLPAYLGSVFVSVTPAAFVYTPSLSASARSARLIGFIAKLIVLLPWYCPAPSTVIVADPAFVLLAYLTV